MLYNVDEDIDLLEKRQSGKSDPFEGYDFIKLSFNTYLCKGDSYFLELAEDADIRIALLNDDGGDVVKYDNLSIQQRGFIDKIIYDLLESELESAIGDYKNYEVEYFDNEAR